jgi:hypothetical protein
MLALLKFINMEKGFLKKWYSITAKCKLCVPLFMNYWCQMENYDYIAIS